MLNVLSKLPTGAKQALALALCATTALAAGAADPGAAIERGYQQALASSTATGPSAGAPEAGSEAYWLGQTYASPVSSKGKGAEGTFENALFTDTFAKGKQIVSGEGANKRTLEIVSVERIEPTTTRIDAGPADNRFLVTCRDTADGTARVLRISTAAPASANEAPHAL